MKKYLYFALAMPLLFACSDDLIEKAPVAGNDQFAGIEKVDATFSMAEGAMTRMDDGSWDPQENDVWGFAWLGDGTVITNTKGYANQNHNLIQTSGIFKPQTSIYVGNYYLYRPYDVETVSPQAINFKSLEEQPLAEGISSSGDAWKALAKTAINIGDKFTNVTAAGTPDPVDPKKFWDKAGIGHHYTINGAVFSNQTGLDLTYTKNNVEAPAAGMHIIGATDIDYTIASGTKIGAADIYDATVQLAGAAKSFTYAPKQEPNAGDHSGKFWATKSNLNTNNIASTTGDAFTWATGTGYDEITLKAAGENGISTDKADNKGWFWFNSLPVTGGNGDLSTAVKVVLNSSYGAVTINSTIGACAQVLEKPSATASAEWMKVAATTNTTISPKEWAISTNNTFINQYGNHRGKYVLTADFSTGVMDGMHIKNDTQLQKLLKYYIAAGKTETDAVLNLDADANGEFKISKLSIALLQTINATTTKVKVRACTTHGTPKIIVTQDGQAAIGLADKKEVPSLVKVFKNSTNVYLSSDCEWTWGGGTDGKTALKIDGQVSSITNEGTLTVNATNVELSVSTATLANAAGATMNITQVTTAKTALTNLGTINVGAEDNTDAELRAYDIAITNDATTLTEHGVINNYGVVGVSETGGTTGKFNNYGLIEMKHGGAITLLSTNELKSNFDNHFNAGTNKMGVVVLPENNPTAIVSVNNAAENGFIKYNWTGATYATPAGIVKYNTIVVSNDIAFTTAAPEVQYIEFNGTRTQVVNPDDADKLTQLKGIMVNAGKSIIIEKTNLIKCADGAYLGAGATVYKGGTFTHNANVVGKTASNYFGDWSTDQIVKY